MQMNNNEKTVNKKIPLSLRMQEIIDVLECEVEKKGKIKCLADVGCDHAFVSMACVKMNLVSHVIAMDVRKGPLSIAQKNIDEYGFGKSVETRLSDGFRMLQVGEAEWAVVAGMGGILMNKILEDGDLHLKAGIGLVLQPQSEIDMVRMHLLSHGYSIVDERMLVEDEKFYTIIKSKKLATKQHLNKEELLYGPVLIQKKDPVLAAFLEKESCKKEAIYESLKKVHTESSMKRLNQLERELDLLHSVQRRIN